MSDESQSIDVYRAIGMTVVNCQFFEIAFTICSKLVLRQGDVDTLSDVQPLSKNAFKTPAKALLNELKQSIKVDSEFETQIIDVVDRRHELIHRWVLKHRWPTAEDKSERERIRDFANQLSMDLNAVTRILVGYIHDWLQKFPETKDSLKNMGNWLKDLPQEMQSLKIENS